MLKQTPTPETGRISVRWLTDQLVQLVCDFTEDVRKQALQTLFIAAWTWHSQKFVCMCVRALTALNRTLSLIAYTTASAAPAATQHELY